MCSPYRMSAKEGSIVRCTHLKIQRHLLLLCSMKPHNSARSALFTICLHLLQMFPHPSNWDNNTHSRWIYILWPSRRFVSSLSCTYWRTGRRWLNRKYATTCASWWRDVDTSTTSASSTGIWSSGTCSSTTTWGSRSPTLDSPRGSNSTANAKCRLSGY